MADGGFTLNRNIVDVVVHIKSGTISVLNLPHDHDCNLDWVASLIIDLNNLALQVLGLQVDRLFLVKWIDPEKSVTLDGSLVLAKKHQDACLVWFNTCNSTEKVASSEEEDDYKKSEEWADSC